MHEWAYYKPGSYWIYQNDSTNNDSVPVLDSTFVNNSFITEEKTIRTASDPQYAFEIATINYYSDFKKSTPKVNYRATPYNEVFVEYIDAKLISLNKIGFCMLDFNINQQLESYPPELILLNSYPVFNLNGKDYTNVVAVVIKFNSKKFANL